MVEVFDVLNNTWIIENFQGEKIDVSDNSDTEISQNFKNYNGKKVIFRNCPNLKKIKANCLNLTGLEIKNCPQLEYLSAYYNEIRELDFTGCKKIKLLYVPYNNHLKNGKREFGLETINIKDCQELESLNVSNCEITELDLTNNTKLKSLSCDNTLIKELNIKHLSELEVLYCQFCSFLQEIDLKGLGNLKELYCFNNGYYDDGLYIALDELKNLKECKSLEILDCAENGFQKLTLNGLPKLKVFSCKTNSLEKLIINDCPNLSYLDYSFQGIYEWNEEEQKSKIVLDIPNKLSIEKNSLSNIEVFYAPVKSKVFGFERKPGMRAASWFELDWEHMPKLKTFAVNHSPDNFVFEEYLNKKRQQEQRRNNFDEGYETDEEKPTFDASNYKIPERKDIIEDHDLSHWNLTGKLVIDGWANLKSLNVGNNELNALVVKNCPKLKRLIYSHNKMRKEAVIENCPNLVEIDKENYNGGIIWKEELSEEEKTRIENLKKTEEYNDKLYLLFQCHEDGENITLDELTQIINEIDVNLIDHEYKVKLLTLYNEKLRERFPQFYKDKKEQDIPKIDYEKLYNDLLDKIERGEITLENKEQIANSQLSEKQKQELYKKLSQKNSVSENNQPTSSLPYIFGGIGLVLVIIGLVWLVNRNKGKK